MKRKSPGVGPELNHVPEVSADQLRKARSMEEAYPGFSKAAVRRGRGPQKSPKKLMVSMRIDTDVVDAFRSTGKGWQSRVNDLLRKHRPTRASDSVLDKARQGATAKRTHS